MLLLVVSEVDAILRDILALFPDVFGPVPEFAAKRVDAPDCQGSAIQAEFGDARLELGGREKDHRGSRGPNDQKSENETADDAKRIEVAKDASTPALSDSGGRRLRIGPRRISRIRRIGHGGPPWWLKLASSGTRYHPPVVNANRCRRVVRT